MSEYPDRPAGYCAQNYQRLPVSLTGAAVARLLRPLLTRPETIERPVTPICRAPGEVGETRPTMLGALHA